MFCNHNSLVQVVSAAMGGTEEREDLSAGATTAEGAVAAINAALRGG